MLVSKTKTERLINFFVYLFLILSSIMFLLPLFWMVSTSLKSYEENLAYIPTWFPKDICWSNYTTEIFDFMPFMRYFGNSVFLVVVGTTATIFSSTLIAYGFARTNTKLSKILFFVLLGAMMLPTQTTMISSYVIWSELGLTDTYVPLLINCFFGGNAFYIFLIRQFIRGIPKDLEEAAIIDGANKLQVFFSIVLPLLKPVLATVAIFSFQAIWNDYMGPLIYIKKTELYTLAQALTEFQMPHETLWGPMMAASLISIVPIVLLFGFCQKYFISGITLGSVKS